MVDADDFVSGTSIKWGRIAQAITGSSVLAIVYGVSEAFRSFILGIVGLGERSLESITDLGLRSIAIVLGGYDAALVSFRESVALLGPLALPIGALVGAGVLWSFRWVIENV